MIGISIATGYSNVSPTTIMNPLYMVKSNIFGIGEDASLTSIQYYKEKKKIHNKSNLFLVLEGWSHMIVFSVFCKINIRRGQACVRIIQKSLLKITSKRKIYITSYILFSWDFWVLRLRGINCIYVGSDVENYISNCRERCIG